MPIFFFSLATRSSVFPDRAAARSHSRALACHWRLRPTTTPRMASPTLSRIFPDCLCPRTISSSCTCSRPTAVRPACTTPSFASNPKPRVAEWRQESQREAAIRAFFSSLGIAPSQDYLAGNGGVPDATRILDYPIKGSTAEVTALTKRILQELCGVSATEALDISYGDK